MTAAPVQATTGVLADDVDVDTGLAREARDPERVILEWQLARRALRLVLSDPQGLGGIALHGRHGPARDALLAALPAHGTVRRIPSDADDDALLGGLDTTATLARGRPIRRPGLLDAASDEILVIGGAERLPTTIATCLRAWFDDDSRTGRRPPLVALDESVERSGLVESALGERFALHVDVPELALAELRRVDTPQAEASARRVAAPEDVHVPDETLTALVQLAASLEITSLRSSVLASRAARANAWLDGRDTVNDADAALAAQLVLAPRARALPDASAPDTETDQQPADAATDDDRSPDDEPSAEQPPDQAEEPIEPTIDDRRSDDRQDDDRPDDEWPDDANDPDDAPVEPPSDGPLSERLVQAVTAALPRNLLDELVAGRRPRDARMGSDAAASAAAERSGRPIGTRRPRGASRQRPNLVATLKAAIPWQRLRAMESADKAATASRHPSASSRSESTSESTAASTSASAFTPSAQPRLRVRRDDFRVTRYRQPTRTTTLFVVDASGSAAMHRLAEAKGAVERLLAECYVRRDRVALITFKGTEARLDLPPTRSLVRARRALIGLPGGGGTPLAIGLDLAADQLERLAADGESPVGVVMTDGRGNIARDGSASRARAQEDAEAAARRLGRIGARLLFVDTGPRPRPVPRELAALMGARYLPLPQLDTSALTGGAVR